MTDIQLAAQHLARAIAQLRLAERDAGQSIARLGWTYAVVRTRLQIQP